MAERSLDQDIWFNVFMTYLHQTGDVPGAIKAAGTALAAFRNVDMEGAIQRDPPVDSLPKAEAEAPAAGVGPGTADVEA